MPAKTNNGSRDTGLDRGIGLGQAIALNVTDMVGVGPFITLPLIVGAMGGPQALLGWLLGAGIALCDGLVWAELGAAFPDAGGPYPYLKRLYGEQGTGRLLAFLYVWQLIFSAPLSVASGCVGLALYATYLFPSLARVWYLHSVVIFGFHFAISLGAYTLVAMAAALVATLLLYRKIRDVGRISVVMGTIVLLTLAWVIVAGLLHFDAARAFTLPPHAFHISGAFLLGLGTAMLTATYDYWGYYNVCFLGGEIREPARNIPRAILISIVLVGSLYLLLNISVLGVLPWRTFAVAPGAVVTPGQASSGSVIAVMMQQIYGAWAGRFAAWLIALTAFASVFSLLLGYSRVPYAAAKDGNFFRAFARLHPRLRIPHISLITLGLVAAVFCLFSLADLIAALVVIRILLQFLLLQVGLVLYRRRAGSGELPFRMPLYPLPVIIAIAGFIYILVARAGSARELVLAAMVALAGVCIFAIRNRFRRVL
jgi:amino acid transporter